MAEQNQEAQEMEDHKRATLSWVASAGRDDRFQFLKRILDIIDDAELQQVPNLVSKAKKRRKRRESSSTLSSSVEKSVSVPSQDVSVPSQDVSVPSQDVSVPASPTVVKNGWYRQFKPQDILALDVEKVDYEIKTSASKKKKFKQVAAKITLVDIEENVIYQKTIWHKNGDYRITPISFKCNGIRANSLQVTGYPKLGDVKAHFENNFADKLIIGVNLVEDFESLDIPSGDYNIFDLQWYWWVNTVNKDGVLVREEFGLRSLCKFFFKYDMQPPHIPHSDEVDAIWTMRLFRDVYLKIYPEPVEKSNDESCNNIKHFKSLYN